VEWHRAQVTPRRVIVPSASTEATTPTTAFRPSSAAVVAGSSRSALARTSAGTAAASTFRPTPSAAVGVSVCTTACMPRVSVQNTSSPNVSYRNTACPSYVGGSVSVSVSESVSVSVSESVSVSPSGVSLAASSTDTVHADRRSRSSERDGCMADLRSRPVEGARAPEVTGLALHWAYTSPGR
jgi:hypothetical protein